MRSRSQPTCRRRSSRRDGPTISSVRPCCQCARPDDRRRPYWPSAARRQSSLVSWLRGWISADLWPRWYPSQLLHAMRYHDSRAYAAGRGAEQLFAWLDQCTDAARSRAIRSNRTATRISANSASGDASVAMRRYCAARASNCVEDKSRSNGLGSMGGSLNCCTSPSFALRGTGEHTHLSVIGTLGLFPSDD